MAALPVEPQHLLPTHIRQLAPITSHDVREVTPIAPIQVSATDVWWIVDQLLAIGRADDVTAAFAIENGILAGEPIDELTPGEQVAILQAISNANARLDPLRRALERTHCDRT